MEGLNRSIFEIFEIIIVVSLLLTISTAIIITNDPKFVHSNLMATEIADIATITKKDTTITINYDKEYLNEKYKIQNDKNNNQINIF